MRIDAGRLHAAITRLTAKPATRSQANALESHVRLAVVRHFNRARKARGTPDRRTPSTRAQRSRIQRKTRSVLETIHQVRSARLDQIDALQVTQTVRINAEIIADAIAAALTEPDVTFLARTLGFPQAAPNRRPRRAAVLRWLRAVPPPQGMQERLDRDVLSAMPGQGCNPRSSWIPMTEASRCWLERRGLDPEDPATLWALWSRAYDHDMNEHTRALVWALRGLRAAEKPLGERFVHGRILDLAAGTGSSLDAVERIWGDDCAAFVANERSTRMATALEEKLRSLGVPFQLLHKLLPTDHFAREEPFDTVILAQTLHVLCEERPGLCSSLFDNDFVDEHVKIGVIRRARDCLVAGGFLILVDEDPPLFTVGGRTPNERVLSELFAQQFRPFPLNLLHLKLRCFRDTLSFTVRSRAVIDGQHDMFALVVRKGAPTLSPGPDAVVRALEAIDDVFTESARDASRLCAAPRPRVSPGPTVVVEDALSGLDMLSYFDSVDELALRVPAGGRLALLERWPDTSREDEDEVPSVDDHEFHEVIADHRELELVGALGFAGLHGYIFRRRSDLSPGRQGFARS